MTARRVARECLAVFDRGVTADGLGYLVAEFIDGRPGQARRPAPGDAARLMARSREPPILGRRPCDLKPANILLTPAGS